jgi:hypothetical protein
MARNDAINKNPQSITMFTNAQIDQSSQLIQSCCPAMIANRLHKVGTRKGTFVSKDVICNMI